MTSAGRQTCRLKRHFKHFQDNSLLLFRHVRTSIFKFFIFVDQHIRFGTDRSEIFCWEKNMEFCKQSPFLGRARHCTKQHPFLHTGYLIIPEPGSLEKLVIFAVKVNVGNGYGEMIDHCMPGTASSKPVPAASRQSCLEAIRISST